jgi:hypothetical protein
VRLAKVAKITVPQARAKLPCHAIVLVMFTEGDLGFVG